MTVRHPNLCGACTHYNGDGTCAAFPEEIPEDILLFGGDHRESVPGDHGVVFSQRNTKQATAKVAEWNAVNVS